MTLFFIAIFALIFGSFASCVSYRLGNSEKFVFTRSKCVNCGFVLGAKNLIPLFSYLFQRGKCQKCQQKISIRYPIIEALFLLFFIAIFLLNDQKIDQKLVFLCIFATILLIMSIVDFEHYFIPDLLQIALFIAVLSFVVMQFGYANLLINLWHGVIFMSFGIFLYLLFYFASNVSAIGIDDIKILFTIGFAIGIDLFLPFIFLAGVLGMVFGLIWTKVKDDETFPFAPALALSFLFCLIFDKKLDIVKIMTKYIF